MRVPCSISSPAFGVGIVQDFGHSNSYVVLSHCCFNLHFPDDIQYGASFQMLICHPYILFEEVSVKIFGCFIFLLLSFKNSSYILDNSPLSDIYFAYIFPSLELVFFLLNVSFAEQKFVTLMKSKFSVISFMDQAFGIGSKMSLPNPRSSRFSPKL